MAQRSTLLSISPILAVRDVAVSVAFYVRYLGFEKIFLMEDFSYGVVAYDGLSVHFMKADSSERPTRNRPALYLSVRGIEALWASVLANPPATHIRPLETTPWGMREFHVLDPDGCLLRFGEDQG